MSDSIAAVGHWKELVGKVLALVKQPLFSNAGYLLGVNLVGGVTGVVFWGMAARLYESADIGIASAMLSAITLLAGLAGLGISTGLVRFLPGARHPGRLLNSAFTLNVTIALIVACGFLAGLEFWSPSLVFLQRDVFLAAGFVAYAVATTLSATLQMVFVAHRRAMYTFVLTLIVNGGRLPLVAALAGLDAVGLVGAVGLATVLAVALSLTVFMQKVRPAYQPRPALIWRELVPLIPYSAGNYVAVLLIQSTQSILPLMILEVLGAQYSGYAYVAWMLGTLLTSPGTALAGSAFAESSYAPERLSAVLRKAAVLGLGITVPAALAFGVIAPWLLILFGSDYAQEALGLLRWLAAAAPAVVLSSLYLTWLKVRKQVGTLIVVSGVVALTTLGVARALMPAYGIAASGMGWLIGNGLVAVLAVWRMVKGSVK